MKYGFVCGTARDRVAPVLVSMAIAVSWGFASPASAQGETGAESIEAPPPETGTESVEAPTSETGAESPEAPTSEPSAEVPESATEEQWPITSDTPDTSHTPEPPTKGPYSKRVQGKLWLEAFIGPSSYDPDRFGAGNFFFDVNLQAPKVKGPEFGVAFGGAIADQLFFIGPVYRQASYDIGPGLGGYKLMKAGLDMQFVMSFVDYVHPLIRLGLGYARLFGGNFDEVGLKTNGLYYTLGFGVRIPIVRWVSFVATLDWSKVTIYPKDGGGFNTDGSNLGGTFGLTLHFVGVD